MTIQRIAGMSGLGILLLCAAAGAAMFAPQLKTQTAPAPSSVEENIVTNKVLVRLTATQVSAIRAQLAATPTPTPSDTPSPTPEESVVPFPEVIEGSVLGAHTEGLPAIPDFAVVENLLENISFVTATQEQPATDSSLTDLLKTSVLGNSSNDIPNIDRWVVLELKGRQAQVRVNNGEDLEPIQDVPAETASAAQATRDAIDALEDTGLFEHVEPLLVAKTSRVANDPFFATSGAMGQYFDDLWGLKRIQAPAAWDVTTGSPDVTVAVIDTGIDMAHRDLQGNIWNNPGENGVDGQGREKKSNGVDDDGNGYVDDWRGWDFYSNDNDPTDGRIGHGTHVAGIIGAVGNNNTDIAGVAWNVKLMSLQFLDTNGYGTIDLGGAAMRYAADNGARVINASWGGYGASILIHDAVEYAHSKGVVIVAASGNEMCDLNTRGCWHTPAIEENVIAVSAITPYDDKASFTNYGHKVELVAPGAGHWTDEEFLYRGILSLRGSARTATDLNQHLRFASGTSMASPYVAGVAALVFSAHPDWTADQVRQQLQRTAEDIGQSGRDRDFGFGVVNAARAVGSEGVGVRLSHPDGYIIADRLSGRKIDFRGSVNGTALSQYVIDVAQGDSPYQWRRIRESNTPVTDGLIYDWLPNSDIVDGVITARLTVNPGAPDDIEIFRRFEFESTAGVSINRNEEATSLGDVVLSLRGGRTLPATMRIRNAGEGWGVSEGFATSKQWRLSDGNGIKTVEVEYGYGSGQKIVVRDTIILDVGNTANHPPTVNAGEDRDVVISEGARLRGIVSDDGRVNGTPTVTWSSPRGIGTVTFGSPNALETTAQFSRAGWYELQLSVFDGEHTVVDAVRITVSDPVRPISYLTSTFTRPHSQERVVNRSAMIPVSVLLRHLSSDSLRCVSVKLDGVLVTPASDSDTYTQTTEMSLPFC